MQRLTDLLGQRLGGPAVGEPYGTETEMAAKGHQNEDRVYGVTIIAPVSLVMLDGDKAVIRVEVLARSEREATRKAGVSVKGG